jgi:PPOX class probable F420-dependent enzyme
VVDVAEAVEFVRANDQVVLATLKRDGTPQMSPNTLAVVGDDIVMSTRQTSYKVRNLRRDPRAWLVVVPGKWLGKWVQLECRVEIVDLPEAMDLLVEYYRTLRGEHPDWDDYRRAMVEDQRCILRFDVLSAGPTRSG